MRTPLGEALADMLGDGNDVSWPSSGLGWLSPLQSSLLDFLSCSSQGEKSRATILPKE